MPAGNFQTFDKKDGSLGILYWVGDEPWIATRGSFDSDQAQWATSFFRQNADLKQFNRGITYLFEIVYPSNRIVVDYGDSENLFLLAKIRTKTAEELPLNEPIGFPVVERFDGLNDLESILAMNEQNREGFVLLFDNGERIKIKMDEYKRLHKIITGLNSRHIWEALKGGKSFDELIETVPDEYFDWVKKVESNLMTQFRAIEQTAIAEFKPFDARKDAAAYYKNCQTTPILFKMLDGKPYDDVIWKQLKPTESKTFHEVKAQR